MRARQCTLLLGLLLLVMMSANCLAEIIGPGDYRGYFGRDRWGRDVLCSEHAVLFVSTDVAKKLSRYAGKPLQVKVTEVDQPINPGGAMIRATETVQVLPTPVTIGLRTRSTRVREGRGIALHLTLRNDQAKPLDLNRHMVKIALMTDAPGTTPKGFRDPENRAFWYHQNTYWSMRAEPELRLSYGFRLIPIDPTELSKDTHKVPSGTDPRGVEDVLTLEPSAGCEGDFVLGKEIPPGRYSARAWFGSRDDSAASAVVDFEVVR